jgi:hypothetical protein
VCFWESDVDATERGIERLRRDSGTGAASGSSESEGECLGVEAAEETIAKGLRVRSMGEAESSAAGEVEGGMEGEGEAEGEGETLRGRVRAQFSQGMARLRSASS